MRPLHLVIYKYSYSQSYANLYGRTIAIETEEGEEARHLPERRSMLITPGRHRTIELKRKLTVSEETR